MIRRNVLALSALLPATVIAVAGTARADTIPITSVGGISTESLGSFTGTISFLADGFGGTAKADLAVTLTNTSPAGNGGFITGFVFNLADRPDNTLSVSYVKDGKKDTFQSLTDASASPFGTFEFGAATGGAWLGGGSPTSGIAVGQTRTFLFEFAGSGEHTAGLTAQSFLTNDLPSGTAYPFAVRFRGFKDGGSDKVIPGVPEQPQPVPVPAAVWGGAALLGLMGGFKAYRRRSDSAE